MDNSELFNKVIEDINHNQVVFCKFLSTNDTIRRTSHQCGIYVPNIAAEKILFNMKLQRGQNYKLEPVQITWQDDACKTDSTFTYYGASKDECRITSFGRYFPFLRENDTGDLFVLIKVADREYKAYLLAEDDDIEAFLNYFGISPVETNSILQHNIVSEALERKDKEVVVTPAAGLHAAEVINIFSETLKPEDLKKKEILAFIEKVKAQFPEARLMSSTARAIYEKVYDHKENVVNKPDEILIGWINLEYELFSSLEESHYYSLVHDGFKTMDEFIETANSVLNRRKSRAGKSLENNLAALFDENHLQYEGQVITELNKKPDFVFPGSAAYHDPYFEEDKIIVLGAKTTCKDRWRQVVTEADRAKHKYLCTLQQGNSPQQLKEMQSEKVTLVVPKPYIKSYPREYQGNIMDLGKFIDFVKEKEA